MRIARRRLGVYSAALILLLAVAGPSCGGADPFTLSVIPETLNGESIAGQQCVFLVTVAEDGADGSGAAVALSAAASGGEVTVVPREIDQGEVAEVTVTPTSENVGTTLELTVQGGRGGLTAQQTRTFAVLEGADDRAAYAAELRDRFIPWLATAQPELDITPETEWRGTMVSPQWLVVSHYLFFSKDWEMHVAWHVMIAPDDWARIDLRRRFAETAPSHAFEISSVSGDDEPHPIEPPETIWR